jgi:hypothetical protein
MRSDREGFKCHPSLLMTPLRCSVKHAGCQSEAACAVYGRLGCYQGVLPDGKPIVTKGKCKQYMIQDGKFLQSEFTKK